MEIKAGQIWRSKKNDEYVFCLLRTNRKVMSFRDGNWVEAHEWTVMRLLDGKEEDGVFLPSDMMELVTHEYLS